MVCFGIIELLVFVGDVRIMVVVDEFSFDNCFML